MSMHHRTLAALRTWHQERLQQIRNDLEPAVPVYPVGILVSVTPSKVYMSKPARRSATLRLKGRDY